MTEKKKTKKKKTKEIKETKENISEELKSPEKWARMDKIDSTLFLWWTKNKKLITKEEYKKIKKLVYRSE